jgi:uncharacterized protein YggT (Ycf19 family)
MIRVLLDIYILVLIIDAALEFFPQYSKHQFAIYIKRLSDLTVKPVRRLLPKEWTFDVSWIIVILGIKLFMYLW